MNWRKPQRKLTIWTDVPFDEIFQRGMAEHAKAEWAAAPESVRGEAGA
jgi:hypothetical protein